MYTTAENGDIVFNTKDKTVSLEKTKASHQWWAAYLLVNVFDYVLSFSEEEWYAPYSRKGNNGVYNSANQRVGTAEQPSNDVELEQTNTSPVKRTYYCQDKTNSVKHIFQLRIYCILTKFFYKSCRT